ncbi:MAG: DUF4838 domain-containing protein [Lentisphaerae bacterium]|nr:DUF4838 domain-containing protein [Lentisphaerota bacterium]
MNADVFLTRDGQPAAALVLPDQAHADEELAARELQDHIEKMAGATLEIVRGSASGTLLPIRIGLSLTPGAQTEIEAESKDPAAYRVSVAPDGVGLAGLSPEGTLFAAYELLEQLGVRWYMPGDLGAVIPKAPTLALPAGRTVYAPSFPARHLGVSSQLPWVRRQRLGGLFFPSSHGIPTLPRADIAKEPDLFALRDGERSKGQVCVSNPELVSRATAYVLDYFAKHPDEPWIGMGPNDGGGFCECDDCRALDAGEWDPYAAEASMTDRYVWLFNRILAEVHKTYPGKQIGFYAYHAYKLPPRKHTPDPHIVPALAPITLCRIHGMSNPICPDRSFYKTLMVEWGKLVPDVYERGYYFNLASPNLPFSKVHAIRDETPVAHRAGVKGWRVECMPGWVPDTPMLYVAARLMWAVDTDVDALLQEFYTGFFGPAAQPMGEYVTMIDHGFRDTDAHTGGAFSTATVFTPERMARGRKLLDAAAQQAGSGTVFAQRVALIRLNYDRLEAFLELLDTRNRFDFVSSQKALERLRELTATMVDFRLYPNPPGDDPIGEKRPDTEARALWWRSAQSYITRFWSPTTESGYERLAVRGEFVAGCPDEWGFLADLTDIGESAQWFRDGHIGGNWGRLRTKTASWSDQGLHYFKGLVWYRTQVEIPARFKGRKVFLWFGGIDEAATVWLNGQLLGTSANPGNGLPGVPGTFLPFELDASDAVRFGESNTIAVKVSNITLSELGTGGIVAPVMFWSPTNE